jgi:hypothetical protein
MGPRAAFNLSGGRQLTAGEAAGVGLGEKSAAATAGLVSAPASIAVDLLYVFR